MDVASPGLRWGLPAVVGALSFAAFWPALGNGWVNWDDPMFLLDNPHWRGLSPAHLRWMFTDYTWLYMPLTWVTLGADFLLWGLDARGYHFTSMLIHAANAVLLTCFLRALPGSAGPNRLWSAAAGALFFAIHPLRVEAVAWASARREVVAGFFLLLTLLAYVRMHGDAHRRTRWYVLALLGFVASLLSKQAAMALPVALLILDVFVLRRFTSPEERRRALLEKIPFFLIAVAAVAIAYAGQQKGLAIHPRSVAWRAAQPGYRLSFYVAKTLIPINLSPCYTAPATDAIEGWHVVGLVFAGGVTILLIRRRREWTVALAGWLAFAVLISPALGVLQVGRQFAADRYTYIPSFAFAACVGAGMLRLLDAGGRARTACAAGAVMALGILVALTTRQTFIWRDSLSLWNHALRFTSSDNAAFLNRGVAKWQLGDFDGALEDYNRSLRLHPTYPQTLNNRARIYAKLGKEMEARSDFDAAVRACEQGRDPYAAHVFYNRASFRQDHGDLSGALEDIEEALRRKPDHSAAFALRGSLRRVQGDRDGAMRDFDAALRLNPFDTQAFCERGKLAWERGDVAAAMTDFDRAVGLDGNFAAALAARGTALRQAGRVREALSDLDRTLALSPGQSLAWCDRGLTRIMAGDLPGAEADFVKSLALDPKIALAHVGRGMVRRSLQDAQGALENFARAIDVDPGCLPAYVERAKLRAAAGQKAAALEDYDEAVRRNPKSAQAYLSRGAARLEAGDANRAEEDFSACLQHEPANASAFSFRGVARHMLGRLEAAMADLSEAIRLNPRWPDGYANRAAARAGARDMRGAIEDLARALEVAPPDWPSRNQVTAALAELRRTAGGR